VSSSQNMLYRQRMARHYELKARAESQAQTRQRIVEAAMHLHETLGPAQTTVTAIAEQAGVGRLTVYRHFPQDADLYAACSGTYWERNPAPDPNRWRDIGEPSERLQTALEETYAYHRRTAPMISRALADVGDQPHMVAYHQHWRDAAEAVASGWKLQGPACSRNRAAVGHALSFGTWQSLTRDQGLTDREAISLMICLVTCSAGGQNTVLPERQPGEHGL
jgi:AcrR family transcriptional regulator